MINKHIEILKSLPDFKPTNVVEVGSRDGVDSFYYAQAFDIEHSNVYVFEPNAVLAGNIKYNFQGFNVLTYALSNFEGKSEFNQAIITDLTENANWGAYGISSLGNRALYQQGFEGVNYEKVVVDVKKFSSFVKEHNLTTIDICKIDVEGLTYEVLQGLEEYINIVKSFHLELEYRQFWDNQTLASTVKDFLTSNDFHMLYESSSEQSDSVWLHKSLL